MTSVCLYVYRPLNHSPDYGGSPIPGWTQCPDCGIAVGFPVTDGLRDRSGLGPGLESPPVESREVLRSKHCLVVGLISYWNFREHPFPVCPHP